jgi:hypothetical protein
MPFILSEQRDADVADAFRLYRRYLETERHRFPIGAHSLATSDWYFNPEDHRCPLGLVVFGWLVLRFGSRQGGRGLVSSICLGRNVY